MVLLVQRLGFSLKLFSKLDNHHQSNGFSASLQSYKSEISNSLNQTIPNSDLLSLSHFRRWFELMTSINRAFAKLVMEIDHPMSCWEDTVRDDYLSYSLDLLDLLNSIASSVSNMSLARLSLSHGLSLVEESPSAALEHLKPIRVRTNGDDKKEEGERRKLVIEGGDKDWIVREGLMVMRGIGFRVCGIILSGLIGDDDKRFMELRKPESEFVDSAMKGLEEMKTMMMETGCVLKEVSEVNDGAGRVVAAVAAGERDKEAEGELERNLEILENLLEGVDKDTNHLFSEVLAARNKLLENLRQHKSMETIT